MDQATPIVGHRMNSPSDQSTPLQSSRLDNKPINSFTSQTNQQPVLDSNFEQINKQYIADHDEQSLINLEETNLDMTNLNE